nr:MAG TPA: tail collar domain [Caudoviricetes sp.]
MSKKLIPADTWLGDIEKEESTGVVAGVSVPVGTVIMYMGNEAPDADWLVLDGQTIKASDYPLLFKLLTGKDPVTNPDDTVALADMRSRYPMGLDTRVTDRNRVGNSVLADYYTHGHYIPRPTEFVSKDKADREGWSLTNPVTAKRYLMAPSFRHYDDLGKEQYPTKVVWNISTGTSGKLKGEVIPNSIVMNYLIKGR